MSAEEKIAAILEAEGCGAGNSIHSWRCEYPDRYGPCTCVADLAAVLVEAGIGDVAERDALRERLAKVEALAASWYGVHDGLAAQLRDAIGDTNPPGRLLAGGGVDYTDTHDVRDDLQREYGDPS